VVTAALLNLFIVPPCTCVLGLGPAQTRIPWSNLTPDLRG
jgi:hypothetical protein